MSIVTLIWEERAANSAAFSDALESGILVTEKH